MVQKILLANPRGFCAGVERAIKIVELALDKFKGPIYVNHEIVHNRTVVEAFRSQGVIFSDDLDQIPPGSIYIFSAHGVAPSFRKKAESLDLKLIDATCPLVTKVHWEAQKFSGEGFKIFYIGQKSHQEAIGVTDVANMILIETIKDVEKVEPENYRDQPTVVLTQTTLSVDDTEYLIKALRAKIPHLTEPGDLCYATTNRQDAVKVIAEASDFVMVMGSENSSNSKKLALTATKYGAESELFDTVDQIPENLFDHEIIGLTSGASVPDKLVQEVLVKAQAHSPKVRIEIITTKDESGLRFPLPKEVL
ncbi:MAG TPA: 4-hydroxy-3-methylbut-2-enyl diphosphate reductase [Candidatus Gracilibacteria bacterium]